MRNIIITIAFFFMAQTTSVSAHDALTFPTALTIANQNNPDLKAEIDKAEALRGYFIQSKQYPNPTLGLTAENITGSGIYEGFESAETTLSLALPIPLGGRLHYLQEATYADYLASLATIKIRQSTLYVEVGIAYVDSYYAERWHQVTKKLTKLNENIVEAATRRTVAGAGAALDLRLAEIRLGNAKIQESRAGRGAAIARAKLEQLLNQKIIAQKILTDDGLSHQTLSWNDVLKHLDHSPLLQEKQLQLKAKRATITAVKKAVWPDLTVQLGGRHFSNDGSNAAVVSVGAPVPVFDRNQGKIATAEAQFTQSMHDLQSARLVLKQNLYGHFLQAEQSDYESHQITEKLLPLAKEAVALATEGYQQGRYNYIELSNAITALYDEEKHFQQAHADFHKSLIHIRGLLGLSEK